MKNYFQKDRAVGLKGITSQNFRFRTSAPRLGASEICSGAQAGDGIDR